MSQVMDRDWDTEFFKQEDLKKTVTHAHVSVRKNNGNKGKNDAPPFNHCSLSQILALVTDSADPPSVTSVHQDPAGNPQVKTTAGSHHKLESAPVDKAVNDPVNNTLGALPNRVTSAAASPFEDSTPTIPAANPRVEPEQRPDEPLDKEAPPDGQDSAAAYYEDSADIEESDGPSAPLTIERGKTKRHCEGNFPLQYTYFLPIKDLPGCRLQPALKLLMTPPAPKCLMTTLTLVNHFPAEFENYFRLVP
ncbi:hypothetical protein E4U19_000999 [Claviceps sp. Clav32 group G5]|nr:hypothetical protein E4U19_000999 [Claviceps sp. Clav32 group G5]